MKPTPRLTALATVLLTSLLAAGCGGSDEEPAPGPEDVQAPTAGGGTGPSLPPRSSKLPPLPVVTVTAGANADGTVTVFGTARVSGRVPLRKRLVMDHVPGCKSHEPGLTENVIADDAGGLQNAICYVARGLDSQHFQPQPEEPAVLDQIGCMYVPHVLLMRTDQKLVIRNPDNVRHNVNAQPWRSANEKFNTLVVRGSPELEVVFRDQEVAIPFACDIHSWMKAYVAVIDHDFAALTAADGSYSIEGLPPGKLVFEIWHEEFGRQTLELDLEAGQRVEVDWQYLSEKRKGGREVPVPREE